METKVKMILGLTLVAGMARAAGVWWTGNGHDHEWDNAANWSSYPSLPAEGTGTSGDTLYLDTTGSYPVYDAAEWRRYYRQIHVGHQADGRLDVTGGELIGDASEQAFIGNGGHTGTVHVSGGFLSLGASRDRIGAGAGSAGMVNLSDGTLIFGREAAALTVELGSGSGGYGALYVSGGTLRTRAGIELGYDGGVGFFSVEGSGATEIGIGSHSSFDGSWTQNAGSTLQALVDAGGLTTILIDDYLDDGGGTQGNVAFHHGALLDVGFIAPPWDGSWDVMRWEGALSASGLQWAPGVDTNLWSFSFVDTDSSGSADTLRIAYSSGAPPPPPPFVHPGGLFKQSDLERMRYQIQHRIDPWYSSFLELQAYSRSSYNYTVQGNAYTTVARGGENGNAYLSDTDAAYCNALMWAITQDTRHAAKCVEIFNAWKSLTNVQGGGTESLNAGLFAWKMVEAAEIIKSTYAGWGPSDIQEFKDMLVYPGYSDTAVPPSVTTTNGTFYWRIYQGDPGRHGNQDAIAWRAMITMGVFLDNEKMFDRALRYFKGEPGRTDDIPMPTGPVFQGSHKGLTTYYDEWNGGTRGSSIPDYGFNGVLTNYFWENGQCQESSRDQHHTFFGLSICAGMADVAWNQGDPVWNAFDRRLLKGFEFTSKYNTSYVQSYRDQPSPWEPTGTNVIQRLDRSKRWLSLAVNPYVGDNYSSVSRGAFLDDRRPIYEQAVAHFGVRMGMPRDDYLWTVRSRDVAISHDGYETTPALAWIADQPGWGAICFRRPPLAAGDPVGGFLADEMPVFATHQLSGEVEAVNYDFFPDDGEGHTYHDLTPTNSGSAYRSDAVDIAEDPVEGFYLTDLEAGEWVSYTVHVPADGDYGIRIRYAAAGDGATIRFSFGEASQTADLPLPSTGGATNWTTLGVARDLALTAGVQVMRVHFGGVSGTLRLDRIVVSPMLDYAVDGPDIMFSWPSNHPGWRLETQTNLPTAGRARATARPSATTWCISCGPISTGMSPSHERSPG